MVKLVWDANDFGIGTSAEVKAPYATLGEALLQAAHDLARGRNVRRVEDEAGTVLYQADDIRRLKLATDRAGRPLRLEDAAGKVLWEPAGG